MVSLLKRKVHKLLLIIIDRFSTAQLVNIIWKVITHRANGLPPDEALRFLFHLDSRLYTLEGTKAVEYGKGLHPKHRHTCFHDFFIAKVRSGERVLDIGCGNGAVDYDLVIKAGVEVLGIDISVENIKQAQRLYKHPKLSFIVGNAPMDIPDKHFDVVILSNILEHLKARSAFLQQIRERVHPSRFLIRVPLYERDWRVPLKKELGIDWRLDIQHDIEYTLESFAKEMEAANLKITHQEIRWGEIWAEVIPNV